MTAQRVLPFFLLTLVFALPFWVFGPAAERWLDLALPIRLPLSALMIVCPFAAALIVTARERGGTGVRALLARIGDWRVARGPLWIAAAATLMPAALALSWVAMVLAGRPLPEPAIDLAAIPVFLVLFLVSGTLEEVGWQAVASERLQTRMSALAAALAVGGFWSAWHIVPYLQTGNGATWVAWHCGVTVLLRVLTLWLANASGGSLFVAIVFHAFCNVAYFLFPNYGSAYDPMTAALVLAPLTALVVWLWGPQTLARWRFARSGHGPGRPSS